MSRILMILVLTLLAINAIEEQNIFYSSSKYHIETLISNQIVRRLNKPIISMPSYSAGSEGDILSDIQPCRSTSIAGVDNHFTDFLTLSNDVGTVYLGEKFRCYIALHNISKKTLFNVKLKVDLKSVDSNTTIEENVETLDIDNRLDKILCERVSESGAHAINCICTYKIDPEGSTLNFRKCFNFQVVTPFSINPKIVPIDNGCACIVNICNTTENSLYMKSVEFEEVENYIYEENNDSTDEKTIRSGNLRQYVFIFKYPDLTDPSTNNNKVLGKIRISWSSYFGEEGCYSTDIIENKVPNRKRMVSLVITDVPEFLEIGKPTDITISVINMSRRKVISPVVTIDNAKQDGLFINGVISKTLDELPPGEQVQTSFSIIPVRKGVHTLSGVKVLDAYTQRSSEFSDIIDLLAK
eukprot:TRINITY_DN2250_c3_g1_i2.p1 TRINITY_DN2250_c3_g1~~TRINITY_DN2250_c3_g1_i2.p1  ORF type:complete len:412 (-),score=68.85 TRINITY_DN2250_c3_g1_i2:42-1277(-)